MQTQRSLERNRRGDAAGPRHFGEDLQGLLAAEDLAAALDLTA